MHNGIPAVQRDVRATSIPLAASERIATGQRNGACRATDRRQTTVDARRRAQLFRMDARVDARTIRMPSGCMGRPYEGGGFFSKASQRRWAESTSMVNHHWPCASQRIVILGERSDPKDPARCQPEALRLSPRGILRLRRLAPLIASRCLPAPALRARECNGPLDCCTLRMTTWPGTWQWWFATERIKNDRKRGRMCSLRSRFVSFSRLDRAKRLITEFACPILRSATAHSTAFSVICGVDRMLPKAADVMEADRPEPGQGRFDSGGDGNGRSTASPNYFPSPKTSSRSSPTSAARAWSRKLFTPMKNWRIITTMR